MTFKTLREKREDSLNRYREEAEKEKSNSWSDDDDRFWTLTKDKAGNGGAVIRFLPEPEGENFPWVTVFSHGFQARGGWYIENCPTTIKKKCPACESNTELWNTGIEANKNIVRDHRKRRLSYIVNIYIVKDPDNPSTEGKVFLFRFGKRIFEKIEAKMSPKEGLDEKEINPFDLWQGCNFTLKSRKDGQYVKYDDSSFADQAALFDDDDKLEEIYKQEYSLNEFQHPDKFKSYDELSSRLEHVLSKGDVTEKSTDAKAIQSDSKPRSTIDLGDDDEEMSRQIEEMLHNK